MKIMQSTLTRNIFKLEILLFSMLGFPAIFNTFFSKNIKFIFYLIVYIAVALIYVLWKRKSTFSIKTNNIKAIDWFAMCSLLSVFVLKFLPILGYNAPPLHDPVSHAYLSRHVSEIGMVDYFYSPFLHTVTAFIYQITSIPTPKLILVLNSIFLSLIPVNTYLLLSSLLKNKTLSIITAIAVSACPTPNELFYTAGKNTLIFSICLIIISIFFLYEYVKKNNLDSWLFLQISLIMIFFTHYPAFSIYLFCSAPFLAYNLFRNKKDLKLNIILYLFFVATIGILAQFFITRFPSGIETTSSSITSMNNITQTGQNILSSISSSLSYISRKLASSTIFVFTLLFILLSFTAKKHRNITLTICTIVTTFFLYIFFSSTASQFSNLEILTETANIIGPLLFETIIIVLFGLSVKKQNHFIYIPLVITQMMLLTYHSLNSRQTLSKLNPVSKYDVEAYDFINGNIDKSQKFITGSIIANNILYPTDSGMWIPSYTGNKIATDFGDRNNRATIENSNQINKLINSDIEDVSILAKLASDGYHYAYLDNGIFGPSLKKEDFSKNTRISIVYSNKEVTILRF